MLKIDATERKKFWAKAAKEAKKITAWWVARGESEMTRGAISRAQDWQKRVDTAAAYWAER